MKLGSVKFFKFIILFGLAVLILVPSVLCIFLASINNRVNDELSAMKASLDDQASKEEHLLVGSAPVSYISDVSANYARSLAAVVSSDLSYQEAYPDLYADRGETFAEDIQGSVYLTFDDGPSDITPEILKILRKKEVKATFFVVFSNSQKAADLLRQIAGDGHTIGVHSTTHRYNEIYDSVEAYLADFEKTAVWIEEETGQKPRIFRFPGGSINSYNQCTYQPIIAEMLRRGYVFYDWNASSGDAAERTTPLSIAENTLNGVAGKNKAIVLMHDGAGHRNTPRALPEIIDALKDSGRILLPLDNTVKPVTFSYKD